VALTLRIYQELGVTRSDLINTAALANLN